MNTPSKKAGEEISNLTLDEIQSLKLAAGDDEKWNTIVDQIKRDRGGEFPSDWYKEVIVGRVIEGTITIHSADTQGVELTEAKH